MSKAASNTSELRGSAYHVDEQILQAGRSFPKKGKASAVLRELIAADGYSLSESYLIQTSGTNYITSAVAALKDMGWIITSSRRFTRDRTGRSVQKTCHSLDHINNGISA